MVDKLWYDWQNRDPMNANSFNGGSVGYIYNLAAYDEYPNGGPPYLNVSTRVLAQLGIEEFMLICLHS
jgi:tyrosinase